MRGAEGRRVPSVGLLLTQMALSGAVMGGLRPVASYRAIELGADATDIGILAASFAVGTLLLALPIGRVIDRIGPTRVLLGGAILIPISVAALAAAPTVWGLWIASAAFGVAHLTVLVSSQALAAFGRAGADMDRSFGYLTAGVSIGQAVGPLYALLLPSVLPFTLGPTSVTTGAVLLAALAAVGIIVAVAQVATFRMRHSPASKAERMGVGSIVRMPGILTALLASGAVLACIDLLMAFLPLWAEERGIAPEAVALLLTARALVTIASRFGLARIVARLGRRTVLGASILIGAVALLTLPVLTFWGALAMMLALGFGLGIAQPLTLSWIASRVTPPSRGAALGLRMVSNRAFQTAVPALLGAISPALPLLGVGLGPASQAFLLSGVLMGGTSAAVLLTPAGDVDPS